MKPKSPAKTLESTVEQFLVDEVIRRGGIAEKTKAIGRRGYFDRTVVLPGRRSQSVSRAVNGHGDACAVVWFVELKRPRGGKLSPHQSQRIDAYHRLGAAAFVCTTRESIQILLDAYDASMRES